MTNCPYLKNYKKCVKLNREMTVSNGTCIACESERNRTITKRVINHLTEALCDFKMNNIVGIFLQGSQNYRLEIPGSDVDTKLIVTPAFKDLALDNPPVSTTHVRENDEHTDWKDIRSYVSCFRKQNLNFLEILFTDFFYVNPTYSNEWERLVKEREAIAHMNPYRAVKSMKGIALEKYHAMEHRYPSKIAIIDEYGYDPKQVSHLVRVRDYIERYLEGETYESCLIPSEKYFDLIMGLKKYQYNLDKAREIAKEHLACVEEMADKFCAQTEDKEDPNMRDLLQDVSYNIMKISVEKELKNG